MPTTAASGAMIDAIFSATSPAAFFTLNRLFTAVLSETSFLKAVTDAFACVIGAIILSIDAFIFFTIAVVWSTAEIVILKSFDIEILLLIDRVRANEVAHFLVDIDQN